MKLTSFPVNLFLLLVLFLFPFELWAQHKVGVIIPLSGEVQFWGEGIQRGLETARSEHREVLKFIYEDETFCNSKAAVLAAKKLLEQDRVKLLITGCLNGTKAIQAMAKRNEALILSAGFVDQESIKDFDNVISLSAQIGTEASHVAAEIRKLEYKKLFLFRHDDAFTGEFSSQLKGFLSDAKSIVLSDIPVIDQSYPWQSQLVKAKKEQADAYIIYLGKDETINFLKAKNRLQDKTQILGGYIIESNFDPKHFRDLLDGVMYTYPKLAKEDYPKRAKFEKGFQSLFGSTSKPTINAYFVYDGMQVLVEAFRECKNDDTKCINRFFSDNRQRTGASGDFSYQKNGSINRIFVLKEVKDGAFVVK